MPPIAVAECGPAGVRGGELSAPVPSVSSAGDDACVPDYERYYSDEGRARIQGTLRSFASQFAGVPGVVSLAGGFPPSSGELFPLSGLTLRLADGLTISVDDPITITTAQQYNSALWGHPPLVEWARRHVATLHVPPAPHGVLITNGSNHALELITSLLLDRGDSLLMEEYTYPVITESIALPKGYTPLALPIDQHGIIPERMREVLERAQRVARQGGPRFPKVLYTVPTGHNPTGCSITPERRRAVYRLCRQYGLLIIEDDPYMYLQYGAAVPPRQQGSSCSGIVHVDPGSMPGLQGLGPTYLSLDVDARVIRVDSFAKFLAPGLRLGWVTAPPPLAEKLVAALQAHTVGPCSLSQVVVAQMLAAWGDAGLCAHLRRVQAAYATRAALCCAAAATHLTGLADWTPPAAGMFLWLRLAEVRDSQREVWDALRAARVMVLPGRVMHCREADPAFECPHVRLAFSACEEGDLEEGVSRLAVVLRALRAQRDAAALPLPAGAA